MTAGAGAAGAAVQAVQPPPPQPLLHLGAPLAAAGAADPWSQLTLMTAPSPSGGGGPMQLSGTPTASFAGGGDGSCMAPSAPASPFVTCQQLPFAAAAPPMQFGGGQFGGAEQMQHPAGSQERMQQDAGGTAGFGPMSWYPSMQLLAAFNPAAAMFGAADEAAGGGSTSGLRGHVQHAFRAAASAPLLLTPADRCSSSIGSSADSHVQQQRQRGHHHHHVFDQQHQQHYQYLQQHHHHQQQPQLDQEQSWSHLEAADLQGFIEAAALMEGQPDLLAGAAVQPPPVAPSQANCGDLSSWPWGLAGGGDGGDLVMQQMHHQHEQQHQQVQAGVGASAPAPSAPQVAWRPSTAPLPHQRNPAGARPRTSPECGAWAAAGAAEAVAAVPPVPPYTSHQFPLLLHNYQLQAQPQAASAPQQQTPAGFGKGGPEGAAAGGAAPHAAGGGEVTVGTEAAAQAALGSGSCVEMDAWEWFSMCAFDGSC